MLNQLHEERAVTDRVKAHAFHVVRCQLAILWTWDVKKGLEEPVVELREETVKTKDTVSPREHTPPPAPRDRLVAACKPESVCLMFKVSWVLVEGLVGVSFYITTTRQG